jgi:hypothetical protein
MWSSLYSKDAVDAATAIRLHMRRVAFEAKGVGVTEHHMHGSLLEKRWLGANTAILHIT